MSKLSTADYFQTVRLEAARLAEIHADQLPLALPHIDGWTVHDVVGHTGWIYRWVAITVSAPPENPPQRADVPEPPPGPDVLPWFEESVRIFFETLEAADSEKTVATFTGPQPVTWWIRRMAHETSMHRWDAEAAIATPVPIDPAIARDGIDEVLEIFVPSRLQFDVLAGNGETVHLHATDIDEGEWVMTFRSEQVDWEHAHVKADVAARGPVSDLLLLLWSRLPPSRLDTFGETSLLHRWQEAAAF